ncbi:MAG: hypothetical protein RR721_14190 [Aeromonas sp.]|uniref:hypothetical protein n=1 Tax=Aeromonas sp. TaxID=647 RepID=UPI002FC84E73
MRNSISHLLSRLLNSGAAFDAPPARREPASSRQETALKERRDPGLRQHGEPKIMNSANEVNGKIE